MSDGGHAAARAAALAAALMLGIGCAGSDGGAETAGETAEEPEAPRRELFRVPTEHMEPALRFRQIVTIDSQVERFQPGDIVVFRPPSNAEANDCAVRPKSGQACTRSAAATAAVRFVQRVVAVGGERLAIQRGRVVVEGRAAPDRYATKEARCPACDLPTPVTVPRGYLYVMSDRRALASDSRHWGPIREEWVSGTVVESP
jgi:signal peptidase I